MKVIYTEVKPTSDIARLVRKKIVQSVSYMGKTYVARWSVNKGNLMKKARKLNKIGRI